MEVLVIGAGAGTSLGYALKTLKDFEEQIHKLSVTTGIAAEEILEAVVKLSNASTMSCAEIIIQLDYLNTPTHERRIFSKEDIYIKISRLKKDPLIPVSKIQQKTGNPIDAILKKRKW